MRIGALFPWASERPGLPLSDALAHNLDMLEKLISGGQTGADRAALDTAIHFSFPHGGWCPKGRIALDGVLAPHYRLQETPSADYSQRTRWNIRDSDATAVFTMRAKPGTGSKLTIRQAEKLGKSCLHIVLKERTDYQDPVVLLQRFVAEHQVKVLNVAGSRASEGEEGIHEAVSQVLRRAFFGAVDHPGLIAGAGEG